MWRDRLRATVAHWDRTDGFGWTFLRADEWVCDADFADWLFSEPVDTKACQATFKCGVISLTLLATRAICLPPPTAWSAEHALVFIGAPPDLGEPTKARGHPLMFPHEGSIARFSRCDQLDFFAGPFQECGFVLSLWGLPLPTGPRCEDRTDVEKCLQAL